MQNQPYSKSFLNPTATSFTVRARPSPFSTFAPGQRQDAVPHEEAWTQYDGLGPVPRDPRLDRNWRQAAPPGRGQQPPHPRGNSQGRGANHQQHQQRGEPASKRTKQTPQSQTSGRNAKTQNIRGGGRSTGRSSGEIIDEAYLAKNFTPLKKEDYPNATNSIFNNPKSFFWDTKGSSARSTFVSQRGGLYQCTVFIKLADGSRIEAIGDATNKKVAEKIACQHAILKLHQSGRLKELVYGGVHSGSFDQNLLKEEEDAKMDIYDYCARYDTVPQFISTDTTRPGNNRKTIIQVTIKMPKQGIEATARATDRRVADILASVEFKRQAEEWHAKHGDEDILVKDVANVLNSRNAKKFFEFYKIHNPGAVMLNDMPIGDPVEMGGKKNAETAAWVTAAVALKNQNPELFPKFIEALRMGNGEILKPVNPTWLNLEQDSVIAMTDTLLSVRRIGLPPTEEEMAFEDAKSDHPRRYQNRKLDPALTEVKSKKMLEAYEEYLANEKLQVLRQKRSELPMNQYTNQVLELVNGHEVSIIVGATGSGKTTQVPQILLEEAIKNGKGADCNVICTQPRRIAATSVAQRVAVERNEPLQKSVGYQVRFDAKLPMAGGSITYCTTGILLQQLRNNPDEVLDGITHLVIDEVHERDIMIDYLLIILKRILKNRRTNGRPSVKVVLMSATMNTELPTFERSWKNLPRQRILFGDIKTMLQAYPTAQLGLMKEDDTRNYMAIEQNFTPPSAPASGPTSAVASAVPSRSASPGAGLDDDGGEAVINWKQEVSIRSDGQASISTEKDDAIVPIGLAATTLAHIVKTTQDGAVLVFLPGLDEILKLEEALVKGRPLGINFADTTKYKLYMLHSSIPNQNEVFDDIPEGCRKIILSTNIAETSITIPDVKFVVDAGKLREKQYEQARRITQLVCTWVSKSNSKQRAGRAGRVQNGTYYALFSRNRFDSLRATGLPEMLRSDLQEICLDIKLQGFKDPIARFLSEAIEPPAPHAIEASLRQLLALGAIDQNENLTQLGH
ncbi:P-loop containing nucleoside triphosphate hydrolase protein, partial [Trichophaea hybrida]